MSTAIKFRLNPGSAGISSQGFLSVPSRAVATNGSSWVTFDKPLRYPVKVPALLFFAHSGLAPRSFQYLRSTLRWACPRMIFTAPCWLGLCTRCCTDSQGLAAGGNYQWGALRVCAH